MDQQHVKTEADSFLGAKDESAMETLLAGADDIGHQNQTAQLFFEALLQTSRTQLLSDCGMSAMNQAWTDGHVSHDNHMTSGMIPPASPSNMATDSVTPVSNMAERRRVKLAISPSVTGRSCMKVVSPQLSVPTHSIKQSTSPIAPAASPKKRSRRQTTGTMDVTEESGDCGVDVMSRRQGLERSVSESSSDTATPRRRGSNLQDGGRRSRTQSESENDLMSDPVAMMSSYASDDVRRQMAGSVTPETDVGFQPSMLDAVLTEKKLALLRSPEVRQFLQQQQAQRAKERKLTHSSPPVGSKGDNSS